MHLFPLHMPVNRLKHPSECSSLKVVLKTLHKYNVDIYLSTETLLVNLKGKHEFWMVIPLSRNK